MLVDKTSCTGCSACFSVCPTGAIKMQQDEEGFFHPVINMERCISCGRCERACPLINPVETSAVRDIYACYNIENPVRLESSSGGVFSILAEEVIRRGGRVFGASFEDSYHDLHHIGVDGMEKLSCLRGSKYVQSDLRSVFCEIQKYLRDKRYVLFVGTPCQVAGLRKVAVKNIEYLLTVEFVCHGVPSPAVWSSFLQEVTPNKVRIQNVKFRDKALGWKKYSMKIFFENEETYVSNVEENPYLQGFLSGLYMRPSCYQCPFRKKDRVADLMIGDCWGVEHLTEDQSFWTDQGVSLLSVQSAIGESFLQAVQSSLHREKISYVNAVKYNRAIISDSYQHPHRSKFFQRFKQGNLSTSRIISEELDLSVRERIERRLWGVYEALKNWCIRKNL